MINRARLHSDLSRLGRETEMLQATVASFSDEEMGAPSLCEGWTRADVIAHVATSGRALIRLIGGAVFGEESPLYDSTGARSRAISTLAALPREELIAELRESARNFSEHAQQLVGELAAPEVQVNGKAIPASSIVALRIAEVVVHHHDLSTAWTIAEADPDSLLDALETVVRSMEIKGAPGMTLATEERDEWVIGDGGLRVSSDREGLLQWLARGDAEHIDVEGLVPTLPSW
jgi:maleylpyruvate isomerase